MMACDCDAPGESTATALNGDSSEDEQDTGYGLARTSTEQDIGGPYDQAGGE